MIPQPSTIQQSHERDAEESRKDHHSVRERESESIFRDELPEFESEYRACCVVRAEKCANTADENEDPEEGEESC